MTLRSQTRNSLRAALANTGAFNQVKGCIDPLSGGIANMTFTVGTEATNAIVVACQALDEFGNVLTERCAVTLLLLADANGDAFNTENYTIAAGTDGALQELVADKVLLGITEADGDLDVSLTLAGAGTSYLACVLPSGRLVISGAITHAA